MGFFRKKAGGTSDVTADGSANATSGAVPSVVVANEIRSFTAAELQPFVTNAAGAVAPDARQYLIVGDNVGRDGRSADWEFHVLFPSLQAEGVWRLGRSADETSSVLTGTVMTVPAPGTTEFLMAQLSPQLGADQQKAWQLRLELIVALPTEFADTPEVVAAIEALQPNVFVSGPIRLKARTPPNGGAVWEWKGSDLVHVPFTFELAERATR